jgi:nucleoside-diphosphate-sugar epimerase
VIVHTAYLLADRSAIDHQEAVQTNVAGFLNVLEERSPSTRSSTRARRDTAPTAPPSVYGAMKLVNERQAAAVGGVRRHCGVRIANVYGDVIGRGQTGWLSTAVRDALLARDARVELAPDAPMGIVWRDDVGERLARAAVSPPDIEWPPAVDGGAERVTGSEIAAALRAAGASSVTIGDSRYDYPSTVPSPWLDAVAGAATPFVKALTRMANARTASVR